jgi:hypothetical protein
MTQHDAERFRKNILPAQARCIFVRPLRATHHKPLSRAEVMTSAYCPSPSDLVPVLWIEHLSIVKSRLFVVA